MLVRYMSERGCVASFRYALNGVDLVAPVWHVSVFDTLLDDDLGLVPLVDPRLRVVALSDALQLRRHLRLVVLFSPRRSASSACCDLRVSRWSPLQWRRLLPTTTFCSCLEWHG